MSGTIQLTVESIPSTATIPGLKLEENLEVRCCPFLSVEFYEWLIATQSEAGRHETLVVRATSLYVSREGPSKEVDGTSGSRDLAHTCLQHTPQSGVLEESRVKESLTMSLQTMNPRHPTVARMWWYYCLQLHLLRHSYRTLGTYLMTVQSLKWQHQIWNTRTTLVL